jgi:glucose-1-phosphate thymidylyltransferase
VSDQAVIGIYYFKEVADLKKELQFVLENNIINGGEYQINDGIKRMMEDGKIFKTGAVTEWMDCGNKEITIQTNRRMLGFLAESNEPLVADNAVLENSKIIPPCFIGKGVKLKNSTIGPHASIGEGTVIEDSTVKNSIIQTQALVKNAALDNAMIGNHAVFNGDFTNISIGDYSMLT